MRLTLSIPSFGPFFPPGRLHEIVDLARRALLGESQALTIAHHVVPIWFDVFIVLGFGTACLMVATRFLGQVE